MAEREILFRGKRTYNGKWVEGSLVVTSQCNAYIISTVEDKRDATVLVNQCSLNVDPETVGQYTGLKDKNGVRIFEGDIVHCVSKLDSADMVVIFECGQFRMVLAEKYHEYQTGVGYYDINCFTKEVIGNIHDNPDMLKEALKPIAQDVLASATDEGEEYIAGFTLMQG